MRIVAAIMDVGLLKFCRREWTVKHSVKKFLVYDPKLLVPKETKDERTKPIR